MQDYATALADAIEAALPRWVAEAVRRRAEPAGRYTPAVAAEAAAAGQEAAAAIVPEVRRLLDADIDEQWTTPLAVARGAVRFPTAVLQRAGVPPVPRDDDQEARFPDDVYDLAPASFADLGPEVAEPGLEWGAAKAHTHMQRHRSRS